jgi:hypothetical protein
VAALVVAALVVVVVVASNRGGSSPRTSPPSSPGSTTASLTIQNVSVFHLERDADGAAHVDYAIDGNPNTAWQTDRYFGPRFANLRHGLGLVLTLGANQTLHTLTVTSSTPGWTAEVYVADSVPGPAALAPWGSPVDSGTGSSGVTTFNLHDRSGRAILLWLTDLGPNFQASIAEVAVH